ncbi:hypothetical protein Tco_1173187 [Tanacetum coccineum]
MHMTHDPCELAIITGHAWVALAAEELETALIDMVKQDNRRQLSAKDVAYLFWKEPWEMAKNPMAASRVLGNRRAAMNVKMEFKVRDNYLTREMNWYQIGIWHEEVTLKHPTLPVGCSPGMDNIHLSYIKNLRDTWNRGQISIVFYDQYDGNIALVGADNEDCSLYSLIEGLASYNAFKIYTDDAEGKRSFKLVEVRKEGGQLAFQLVLYPMDAFVKVNMTSYLDVQSKLDLDVISKTELDNMSKLKETLSNLIAYECKSNSSKFVEFRVLVQISNVQLEQYCSMLLSNAMALSSCSKTDTVGVTPPNLGRSGIRVRGVLLLRSITQDIENEKRSSLQHRYIRFYNVIVHRPKH